MPIANTKYNTITNLRSNLTPVNPDNGRNYIIAMCDVSAQLQKIYLTNRASYLIHPFSVTSNCQNKFNNNNIIYRTISGQNFACHSCVNTTTSFNNNQIQKQIQNQVGVESSQYTMNLASLNIDSADKPELRDKKPWNNQSDRKQQHGKNKQINSSIKANYGVDIKHNSYDRYLARKKSGHLKANINAANVPLFGNKTKKFSLISDCKC